MVESVFCFLFENSKKDSIRSTPHVDDY